MTNQSEGGNIRFFKIMDYGSFEKQMSIPKNFVESFKEEELEGWWTLIGPSRNQWRVKIKRIRDETCFSHRHGWPVFVQDHNIKAADIVQFCYVGSCSFNVFIYDHLGCERESAHFTVNSGALTSLPICSSSFHPSSSVDDVGDDDEDDSSVEIIGTSYSRPRGINTRSIASRVHDQSRSRLTSAHTQGNGLKNERSTRQSSCGTEKKTEGWRRRAEHITMAHNFMIENKHTGMPIIKFAMQDSNLGYAMCIPKHWAAEHMLLRDHNVKLKVPGVERRWTVECRWVGGHCKLRRGWQNFVVDNKIKEHDICVFEMARKGEYGSYKPAIINVYIFRAPG